MFEDLGSSCLFFELVFFVRLDSEVVKRLARDDFWGHADGQEEAEEPDEGVDEAHALPEVVVVAVVLALVFAGSDIDAEVPHHQGPECPWHEVLDGEAPPEDEGVGPPLSFDLHGFVGALDDLHRELVSSVEEDVPVPVSEVVLLHQEEGGEHGAHNDQPEDDNTPVGGDVGQA